MVPVSLTIPQFSSDPSLALQLAEVAADLGFAGIFVFDHLVPLGNPKRPVLEAFTTLGALAARSTVRIGSLVIRATMRPPEVTAAGVSAWAAIARHGVAVGIGIGDSQTVDEAERFGQEQLPLADRVRVLRETITAIRAVAPNVPIWVGGRHPRVIEVAAELADGWNGWMVPIDEIDADTSAFAGKPGLTTSWGGTLLLAPDQQSLEQMVEKRGGSEGAIAGTPSEIASHLAAIGEHVDELVVSVVPNRLDNWKLLAESIHELSAD